MREMMFPRHPAPGFHIQTCNQFFHRLFSSAHLCIIDAEDCPIVVVYVDHFIMLLFDWNV